VSAAARHVNRTLRWAQRVLFACGIAALGYCALVMAQSWYFQREETRNLERLVVARQTPLADTSPDSVSVTVHGLIGRIAVERLGVSVIVMEGTDERTLRRAAGHITGTALPGEPGNVGIAAHRDTFFRPLRDIRKDDVITVTTPGGHFRYRVISTSIVGPDNVTVLDSDGSDVLTLVTCYPFSFIGPAPNRFIVRAEQIG
jgi:sortase A